MSFISNILDFFDTSTSDANDNPDLEVAHRLGAIGAFGNVLFEVNTFRVLTYKDFRRSTKTKLATHNIIGKTPILEYLGQDVEEISFKIQLHSGLGVNPWEEYVKLLDICRSGEANYLIIATHAFGNYKWLLESVDLDVTHWGAAGSIISCECDLKLKEYARG